MDFVIHACIGGLIGRAAIRDPATPEDSAGEPAPAPTNLVRLGALAAILPDADHVLELVSANAYLVHHRTFSHSILLSLVATAAIAAAFRHDRKRVAAVAGLALASHLILDVLTPFGTGIPWPFSSAMLAVDGLQIIAPWLGLLCVTTAIAGTIRGRRGAAAGRQAAWIGLALIGAFLVVEYAAGRRAAGAVEGRVVLAAPSWTNPLAGVAFTVDGERLQVHAISVGGDVQAVPIPERCERVPPADAIEAARALAEVQVSRLRVPVARYAQEGEGDVAKLVVFEDAQFWTVDPKNAPFTVRVDPEQGSVVVTEQHRPAQLVIYLLVCGGIWFLTRRKTPKPSSEQDHGDGSDR